MDCLCHLQGRVPTRERTRLAFAHFIAPLSLKQSQLKHMMTSSNGNIFRVTGTLCGEFTSQRWIPRTKSSDAELWFFLICGWINDRIKNRKAGDLRHHLAHYGVIVMNWVKMTENVYRRAVHVQILTGMLDIKANNFSLFLIMFYIYLHASQYNT